MFKKPLTLLISSGISPKAWKSPLLYLFPNASSLPDNKLAYKSNCLLDIPVKLSVPNNNSLKDFAPKFLKGFFSSANFKSNSICFIWYSLSFLASVVLYLL